MKESSALVKRGPEVQRAFEPPRFPRWNRVILASACLALGLGLFAWFLKGGSWSTFFENDSGLLAVFAVVSIMVAAAILFGEPSMHTYLDLTNRQIVTVRFTAFHEKSKLCRPLKEFRSVVVRHLCHPGGEGPDTFTGSVGFKPLEGKTVLWLVSFPTNEDEVPRDAYVFAKHLQELTGLPVTPSGEFIAGTL